MPEITHYNIVEAKDCEFPNILIDVKDSYYGFWKEYTSATYDVCNQKIISEYTTSAPNYLIVMPLIWALALLSVWFYLRKSYYK